MAHLIIKIVSVDSEKEVKFNDEETKTIQEADKVRVEVTTGSYQNSKAVIVVTCE